jgi:hypothetical protein
VEGRAVEIGLMCARNIIYTYLIPAILRFVAAYVALGLFGEIDLKE